MAATAARDTRSTPRRAARRRHARAGAPRTPHGGTDAMAMAVAMAAVVIHSAYSRCATMARSRFVVPPVEVPSSPLAPPGIEPVIAGAARRPWAGGGP